MPANNWLVASLAILSSLWIWPVARSLENLDGCGGRLERALDALRRDSPRRNRLDEEEAGIVYQQKLASAPLEMSVSRIAVKLPQDPRDEGRAWARVDTCSYEPKSNALETRVMFNDLSISGIISLLPRWPSPSDDRPPTGNILPAESCRMSLRLRQAGIEFYTNPIARGRGQMRIRTESSFLEPRFASIYAYGCRPTRTDKQIKRYDKWPQYYHQHASPAIQLRPYEAPEPRGDRSLVPVALAGNNEEAGSVRGPSAIDTELNLGIWRKNIWVTRVARNATKFLDKVESGDPIESSSRVKNSLERETRLSQREFGDDDFDRSVIVPDRDPAERNGDWLSREAIATEMEDVFLRGASQALTRYIERQLHPAIKETLMISMGYTVSYG